MSAEWIEGVTMTAAFRFLFADGGFVSPGEDRAAAVGMHADVAAITALRDIKHLMRNR